MIKQSKILLSLFGNGNLTVGRVNDDVSLSSAEFDSLVAIIA